MRKKELLQLLEEQKARIVQLEQCVQTQDGLIEQYQKRERSIVAALENAHEAAEKRIADAERQAAEIEKRAQSERERMLEDAETQLQEYRDMIARYNDALMLAAREAAENAERFASFARKSRIDRGDIVPETRETVTDPDTLPDAGTNPAQLMRNIYRLQNRALPEEMQPAEVSAEKPEHSDAAEALQNEAAPQGSAEKPERIDSESALNSLLDTLMTEEPPVQTVASVLGENHVKEEENGQELSLDALLDEIIKSGEQNNG